MDVQATLKALQGATGWTQAQLAQELGANQNDVSRWLKGREPRGHTMEAIRSLARRYGVLDKAEMTHTPPPGLDIHAELAEVFADLLKADEAVKRRALKLLRTTVYGPSPNAIRTNGSS